ncbi:hypothetical protein AABM35_05850 [Micrococcus luteus]|uniref:hypothetical protein n=1 Tax=Micrococcus luteus TaxID=1270 RepID=UPI003C2B226E
MTEAGNKQQKRTPEDAASQGFLDPREWRIRLENTLDFPATVREALTAVRSTSAETLTANEESGHTHDWLLRKKMEIIKRELEKPHLTQADRNNLMAMVDDLIDRANEKDTENRRFLAGLAHEQMRAVLTTTGLAIGTAGIIAVAAITGPDGLRQIGQMLPQIAQRTVRK